MGYILTNGKEFVARDLIKSRKYHTVSLSSEATEFTFNQAKNIIMNATKGNAWLKNFKPMEVKTEVVAKNLSRRIETEEYSDSVATQAIASQINKEIESFLNLKGYDQSTLISMKTTLAKSLSYYDLVICDIVHFTEFNNPPANIRTKIYGKLQEFRKKHSEIKEAIRFVDILIGIDEKLDIRKIQRDIKNNQIGNYKGRTPVYEELMNMIGGNKNEY